MTWFFALLVVAAMGVTAVVATGRGGELAEVEDDRPARLPTDRPLTALDLRDVRFTSTFLGYRPSEVDALLARLAVQLEDQPGKPQA
jgi:DivIVA domain-containing protein